MGKIGKIVEVEKLLHKRIIDKCIPIYLDGHFPQAALEAMKQVEIAIKEKRGSSEESVASL